MTQIWTEIMNDVFGVLYHTQTTPMYANTTWTDTFPHVTQTMIQHIQEFSEHVNEVLHDGPSNEAMAYYLIHLERMCIGLDLVNRKDINMSDLILVAARIMTCGKYGAMNLSFIAEHQPEFPYKKDDFDIDLVWSDFVMCKNYGAACEETQKWNFAGDPKKISPNVHAKYTDNTSPNTKIHQSIQHKRK